MLVSEEIRGAWVINKKRMVYETAQVAITEQHRLEDLNNRNLLSHSSGGWKSEIRVPVWSGSGKSSSSGLQAAAILLCAHLAFLWKETEARVGVRGASQRLRDPSLMSLLRKTLILSDQGLSLMTSFNLNYIYKGPVSKYSHIGSQGFNIWIGGWDVGRGTQTFSL